ncbi:Uncharacterized protein FWK35_00031298 [Aphis craccivora]|uniref:MADF domain-containing protein n=1 Tax=Aphis craccivora TaxID=307492 RepID=A0A6G0VPX1_APHCR|nr:Uncharacterized protein FWK35_00031298 [Aphis craccivora]
MTFFEAVEQYPCLYNFKIPEYARRDITEKAWSKVAEEVKETDIKYIFILVILMLKTIHSYSTAMAVMHKV